MASGGWQSGCSLAMWVYIIASPEDTIKVLPGPQLSSRSAREDLLPLHFHVAIGRFQIFAGSWVKMSVSHQIYPYMRLLQVSWLSSEISKKQREKQRDRLGDRQRERQRETKGSTEKSYPWGFYVYMS